MTIQIYPSILSADFTRLGAEVRALEAGGADGLHLDVMDGHFVPNITFGPGVIGALRSLTALPFDVHLMIDPVDCLLDAFIDSGADGVSFHVEAAGGHPHRILDYIRSRGKKAGIALSPGTAPQAVATLLDGLDFILVMTVNPGFGGQAFLSDQLDKIETLRHMIQDRTIALHVDGGITPDTAPLVVQRGATTLIAGSSILKTADYGAAIGALRCA